MNAKTKLPDPPAAFQAFVAKYPKLGKAWELAHEAGDQGPLDARSARLVKLGIAIGAMREGAVHSAARKARAAGIAENEIDQVVALAAGTIGFPAAVAVHSWLQDKPKTRTKR